MTSNLHDLAVRWMSAGEYALAIAVISWIVGKEEIFRPVREVCKPFTEGKPRLHKKFMEWETTVLEPLAGFPVLSMAGIAWVLESLFRKIAYIPTCEFCTSVWVTVWFYWKVMPLRFGEPGWRAFVTTEFILVGLANFYMSIYSRVRVEIHKEKVITEKVDGIGKINRGDDLHGRGVLPAEGDGLGQRWMGSDTDLRREKG